MEIPAGWIVAIATTVVTGVGAFWTYWTSKEKKRTLRYKEVIDGKDVLISTKDKRIDKLNGMLVDKAEASAKSMDELRVEHAGKVEQLLREMLELVVSVERALDRHGGEE